MVHTAWIELPFLVWRPLTVARSNTRLSRTFLETFGKSLIYKHRSRTLRFITPPSTTQHLNLGAEIPIRVGRTDVTNGSLPLASLHIERISPTYVPLLLTVNSDTRWESYCLSMGEITTIQMIGGWFEDSSFACMPTPFGLFVLIIPLALTPNMG